MINYSCPKCQEKLEAPEERAGQIHPCPRCKFQVQVPAAKSNVPLIVAIVAGVAVVGIGMCCVLAALLVPLMGSNANSAFGTVGASIGSTVGTT
jgi:DNA-directed RNA polymerase subunit RPC12/RpoP